MDSLAGGEFDHVVDAARESLERDHVAVFQSVHALNQIALPIANQRRIAPVKRRHQSCAAFAGTGCLGYGFKNIVAREHLKRLLVHFHGHLSEIQAPKFLDDRAAEHLPDELERIRFWRHFAAGHDKFQSQLVEISIKWRCCAQEVIECGGIRNEGIWPECNHSSGDFLAALRPEAVGIHTLVAHQIVFDLSHCMVPKSPPAFAQKMIVPPNQKKTRIQRIAHAQPKHELQHTQGCILRFADAELDGLTRGTPVARNTSGGPDRRMKSFRCS